MTHSKMIKVNCSPTVRSILCEALKNYASACSNGNNQYHIIKQTDLDDIIYRLPQDATTPDGFFINSKIQAHMEAAISFHYDHIQKQLKTCCDQQKLLLLDALHGVPVDDQQLDTALRKDNII